MRVTEPTTLNMSCPKLLSDAEFKAIQGSELYANMVRNRLVVNITGTNQYSSEHKRARTQILEWLGENSQSLYYVTEDVPVRVYIELDADAVMFKMALDGGDVIPPVVQTPPPPKKPKARPAPAQPIKNQQDLADLLDAMMKKRDDYDQYERERKYKEKEEWMKRKLWQDQENILKTRIKL